MVYNILAASWVFTSLYSNYNPRAHVECDAVKAVTVVWRVFHFNPRTHIECDSKNYISKGLLISIVAHNSKYDN